MQAKGADEGSRGEGCAARRAGRLSAPLASPRLAQEHLESDAKLRRILTDNTEVKPAEIRAIAKAELALELT